MIKKIKMSAFVLIIPIFICISIYLLFADDIRGNSDAKYNNSVQAYANYPLRSDNNSANIVHARNTKKSIFTSQNHDPVIHGLSDSLATEDQLFTCYVLATDPDGDSLLYFLKLKPDSMVIDSLTGIITWLPNNADVDTHLITVEVRDSSGAMDSYSASIIVYNVDPKITTVPNTTASEDTLYHYDVDCNDDNQGNITYSFLFSPMWLSINDSTGVISGVPKNANVGDTTVAVQVFDGNGGTDIQTYILMISNTVPQITSPYDSVALIDSLYKYNVESDDELDGDTWYEVPIRPHWLRLEYPDSGIISGTPHSTDEGEELIFIVFHDGHGGYAYQSYKLIVTHKVVPILEINDEERFLDFGKIPIGKSKIDSFRIYNRGTTTLYIYENSVSDTTFKLRPGVALGPILKNQNKLIEVTFTPTRAQTYADFVTIRSNHNLRESEHLVALLGEGINPFGNDSIPPLIKHNPVIMEKEGDAIIINVEVLDSISGISSVKLYFRKGGQTHFNSLDLKTGQAIIPGDSVTTRGIEYYITAWDNASNFANHPSPSGFHSIQVNVIGEGKESHRGISPKVNDVGTCLISIPLILNKPYPEDVLEDDLGDYDVTEWRFFEYKKGEFIEFPNTSMFVPGKGFLLITKKDSIEFDTGSGISVSTSDTCSYRIIDLDHSWNFIGNPYDFSILSDSLTLANGEPLTNLWSFENNGWHYMPQEIEPWKGYAIKPNSETKLIIHPVSSKILPQLQKSIMNTQPTSAEWAIQIQASCLQAKDVDNYAGIRQNASYQRDIYDLFEPPPIGNYVMVNFPHLDWSDSPDHYSADYQPVSEAGNSWEFEVKTNISSSDIKLEFKKIGFIPENFQIFLIDTVLQISQDLRKENEYTFHHYTQEEGKTFKLLVGTDDFIHGKTSIDLTPKSYKLFQNFPNPFNQETSIIYQLPESGQVTMQVFNLRGNLIKTLLNNEYCEAGYYTFKWNGRDENGNKVTSSVYFYKIKIGSWKKAKKMILIR